MDTASLTPQVEMMCFIFDQFDSEDDHRTGCRNVTHCEQQESFSGQRSPGR